MLDHIVNMLNTPWLKELCNKHRINIGVMNKYERIEFKLDRSPGSIEITKHQITLSKGILTAERAKAIDAMIEIFLQVILKNSDNMIIHNAESTDPVIKDLLEFKLAFQLKHAHNLVTHSVNGKSLDDILNRDMKSPKKNTANKDNDKNEDISNRESERKIKLT